MNTLRIYHTYNLDPLNNKVFHETKLTDEFNLDYYLGVGYDLIIEGLAENTSIPEQIKLYEFFVDRIQRTKLYKIKEEDKELYCASILALWKLKVLSPDDEDSPLWISPTCR